MPESNITKKMLSLTLKNLLKTKSLDKISVSDICEECGINRKTFYYHFKDKYDLINWIYYNEFIVLINAKHFEFGWDMVNEVCTYLYENRSFYRKTFYLDVQNSFTEYFAEFVSSILSEDVKTNYGLNENDEDLKFYVTFYTDAFVMSIRKWIMSMDPIAPDHFVALLRNCLIHNSKVVIKNLATKEELE